MAGARRRAGGLRWGPERRRAGRRGPAS